MSLFSSDSFMPHGHCYLWEPGLLWLQVLSNGLIGLAYLAISLTLVYLVHRGRYLPFKGMAVAFGVFIISCGLTHFLDVYVVWVPVYWFDGTIRALTAVASVGTALMLPVLVPKAVALSRSARAMKDRGIALESALEDLETMYERTRELEQLKTQFFANVSHELRTPLALILGPAERIREREGPQSEAGRDADLIAKNARTLLSQVNDLLEVSRLEAGKVEAEYAELDVGRMVRLLASNFDGLAEDKGLEYRVEGPETLQAELDPKKTERILLNLLSNAFKFTGEGSIRFTLRTREADEGEQVVIEVADSGPGVPIEQRDAVFERFHQLDGGSTRRFGGTGLGLAISRDFAELQQGTIFLDDAPEGGALFRVTLPRWAPQGAEVVEEAEDTASRQQATKRALADLRERVDALRESQPDVSSDRAFVLVVEDNPDMNRFVRETLEPMARTVGAMNGEEGLRAALEDPPDLIITDIMMPKMSGDELVQEVRERSEMNGVPIMLLTAKADDELRVRLLGEGAQDYVMKPFDPRELMLRAENLITMKRARDVLQRELDTQMRDLESLARTVSHKKRELQTALESMRVAREQAEKASRVKSDFLGLVSHELRTPLASLRLQLERLQLESEDVDSGQQRLLGRMDAQTSRLTALIDSLLTYTQIENGRLEVEPRPFDLSHEAREWIAEVEPLAEHRGLQLEAHLPEDPVTLESDPKLVHLVMINLLTNALKFTQEGSVTLKVGADDSGARLSVVDTGPGISSEDQGRIFEPFEQLTPTRHKHLPGVGLGLSLVREIVQSLRGELRMDSEPGRGTEVTVSIPARWDVSPSTSGAEAPGALRA